MHEEIIDIWAESQFVLATFYMHMMNRDAVSGKYI